MTSFLVRSAMTDRFASALVNLITWCISVENGIGSNINPQNELTSLSDDELIQMIAELEMRRMGTACYLALTEERKRSGVYLDWQYVSCVDGDLRLSIVPAKALDFITLQFELPST